MSVKLLLITHSGIGHELLRTANTIFGNLPMDAKTVSVDPNDNPEQVIEKSLKLISTYGKDDGILILTDLFGATPFNIAQGLSQQDKRRIRVLSGLNLPMLFRVLNYPDTPLQELVEKALDAGKEGVIATESTAS